MAKTGRSTRRRTSLPKVIEKYYADLADLARQNVFVEMGTRTAFFALLHAAGKEKGWTLIAEHEKKVGGKTIRPDGTFKDQMNLVRGFWEAKDTDDKFDVEIEKKRKAGYEKLKPWDLDFIETPGLPLSYRVEDKMRLSKDKLRLTVNPSLTLATIPPEALEYRLGNRSALEWVIDQYQVSTDKRSGITSDPNRADDPEYIVRLVGQVIRVSVETVKIVSGLPAEFEPH